MAYAAGRRSLPDRARGLLLGLALGDAMACAEGDTGGTAPLRAGVSTQLAAFTVEGLIRASVRMCHTGGWHAPAVLRHAYERWAALQRGPVAAASADGWLMGVPALAEHRGTPDVNGGDAVTRTLPLGVLGVTTTDRTAAALARDVAGLVRPQPEVLLAAVEGVVLATHFLTAETVRDGIAAGLAAVGRLDVGLHHHDRLVAAVRDGRDRLPDARTLAPHIAEGTAGAALTGGLCCASAFPRPGGVRDALAYAATGGRGVAGVTGAFLGAVHGADALPAELVDRLELGEVVTTLALDLVTELTDSPGGTGHTPPRDPDWCTRYPAS
jgi:hypothetical protein